MYVCLGLLSKLGGILMEPGGCWARSRDVHWLRTVTGGGSSGLLGITENHKCNHHDINLNYSKFKTKEESYYCRIFLKLDEFAQSRISWVKMASSVKKWNIMSDRLVPSSVNQKTKFWEQKAKITASDPSKGLAVKSGKINTYSKPYASKCW